MSPPSIHLGDAVRAAAPVLVAYGLARFAMSDSYQLSPSGWVVLALIEAALLVSGVRIALLEARPPRDRHTVVTRTRELGPLRELVIAGMGGFLLWAGLVAVLLSLSSEAEPAVIGKGLISPPEVVMAVVMFGLPGFFMIYWRPMFSIDMSRGTVRRHRFGRALGPGKSLPAALLRVFSEGYFITNTGIRLGDMIRGRVAKNTFELELIRGNVGPETVARRVQWWAQALHTTPESASETEAAEA